MDHITDRMKAVFKSLLPHPCCVQSFPGPTKWWITLLSSQMKSFHCQQSLCKAVPSVLSQTEHLSIVYDYLLTRDKIRPGDKLTEGMVGRFVRILNTNLDVSQMNKKLATLLQLGCHLDEIVERPGILLLDEQDIIREKLTTMDYTNNTSLDSDCDSQISRLLNALQCDGPQLGNMLSRFPNLLRMDKAHRLRHMKEKISLLQSEGVTMESIRNSPQILSKRYSVIQERLLQMKDARVPEPLPLMWICQGKTRFQQLMSGFCKENDILKGRTKLRTIADLLGVEERNINYENAVLQHSIVNLKRKIDCLLSHGVDRKLLSRHTYILGYSLVRLEAAISQLKQSGVESMTPLQVFWMMTSERISINIESRSSLKQQKLFNLLQLKQYSKKAVMIQNIGHLLKIPMEDLECRLKLLNRQGFSTEVVSQCPLVLAHDTEYLEKVLTELPENKHLQPHEVWLRDKVKLLNAVQYVIEKSVNFSYPAVPG